VFWKCTWVMPLQRLWVHSKWKPGSTLPSPSLPATQNTWSTTVTILLLQHSSESLPRTGPRPPLELPFLPGELNWQSRAFRRNVASKVTSCPPLIVPSFCFSVPSAIPLL
jgi:hypothetical protein